jgi:hypothetical protein
MKFPKDLFVVFVLPMLLATLTLIFGLLIVCSVP